MIAALLLAAGRGSRFGGDKLTASLGGVPVIRWSVATMAAAADVTYVVIPADSAALLQALASLDVQLVVHAGRDAGMGSSIAAGVRALPREVEAVLIALGDQPLVSRDVVAAMCERWRATGAPAVVPKYRDRRGHPVLFARECFGALERLDGDRGARVVLEALGDAVSIVAVDHEMPVDVDTPEALAELARELGDGRHPVFGPPQP